MDKAKHGVHQGFSRVLSSKTASILCSAQKTPFTALCFGLIFVRGKLNPANNSW